MGKSYDFECPMHDESASLLRDDVPWRGFGGKTPDGSHFAESGRRFSNNVIEHWKGLSPLAKAALVISAVVFYVWSGGPLSGMFVSVVHQAEADIVAHRKLADADELKWAEDTFGLFLKDAVPRLESSSHDTRQFFNMLSQGQCDAWSEEFAEYGKFSFNLAEVQGDFTTRNQLRDAFCSSVGKKIVAMRLIWHFPDHQRRSGVALFDVFTRDTPGAPVQRDRWAFFATLAWSHGGDHIQEFQLYSESVAASLDGRPLGMAVSANLQRLNGHDCEGFASALPGQGTANWIMQSLPIEKPDRDELDERPKKVLLEKCRRDTAKDWANVDLQFSSVAGVFPSADLSEAIIFFHKEKRYKGTLDITDDPEAFVVKKAPAPEPRVVNSFYFFMIEAVHISEEWSWKYGWEAKQRGKEKCIP